MDEVSSASWGGFKNYTLKGLCDERQSSEGKRCYRPEELLTFIVLSGQKVQLHTLIWWLTYSDIKILKEKNSL